MVRAEVERLNFAYQQEKFNKWKLQCDRNELKSWSGWWLLGGIEPTEGGGVLYIIDLYKLCVPFGILSLPTLAKDPTGHALTNTIHVLKQSIEPGQTTCKTNLGQTSAYTEKHDETCMCFAKRLELHFKNRCDTPF